MFREIARKKQALEKDECIKILKEQKRGVLALLGDDEYPYTVPINHYYNEEDGELYFHSGKTGHKIDAIKKHPKASFCVYDEGYKKEGDWALNINSVIVFGKVELLENQDRAIEISRKLSYKFTFDEQYIEDEIRKSGKSVLVLDRKSVV